MNTNLNVIVIIVIIGKTIKQMVPHLTSGWGKEKAQNWRHQHPEVIRERCNKIVKQSTVRAFIISSTDSV